MKAFLYTSDPYEPSGVIGLYETEEQKQNILKQYKEYWDKNIRIKYEQENYFCKWLPKEARLQIADARYKEELLSLKEIEIPIGVYGEYY